MTAKEINKRPTTLNLFDAQGRRPARGRGTGLALDEAIDQYLEYLQAVGRRSPATVSAYRSDLSKFQAFLGHGTRQRLSEIDPPGVERWIGSMRDLSTATVRRAVHALSALYRWAIKFGHTKTNPIDRVDTPKAKTRIQPCPTPEEVKAMIEGCNGDGERAALLALATSGLRRAELLAVTWQDVDLQRRRLRIRGKGDKEREALIFDELVAHLYMLHADAGFPTTGAVFRGRQGGPLQESTLQRWFNAWLAGARLREQGRNRYSLHSLRRFAAKQWLNSGLNIRHVQILLGHRDLSTTIRYPNYDLDEIQQAAQGVAFGLTG